MATWWDYVVRVAGTDVQKDMPRDSGISESAFSRWKKGQHTPDSAHVVAFARAYGRPPIEALMAAGVLAEGDAGDVVEVHRGADRLTDDELLAEIRRRMEEGRDVVEAAPQPNAPTEGRQGKEVSTGEPETPFRLWSRAADRPGEHWSEDGD